MSTTSQVFVVDDVPVAAATKKLAEFKVAQNLKIEIDLIRPEEDATTSEAPTPQATPLATPKVDEHGNEIETEKKKRRRRTAAQIDRKWSCTYTGCRKAYGSEGSLTQHMRLKHRSLSMAHRERVNMSVFYTAAANNIAIRPAINFPVGMEGTPFLSQLTPPNIESPPLGFTTSPEHGVLSSSSAVESPQKQPRTRSNSMPMTIDNSMHRPHSIEFDMCNDLCSTPMPKPTSRRRTTSTTTPTSARASRLKTTTPRNLPRTNATRKNRSQSMSCSSPPSDSVCQAPPLLVTRMSDSSLSSTIEGLSLSPSYSYFQATHPVLHRPLSYPMMDANFAAYSPPVKSESSNQPYSLLNSLDWHNASASKTNSPEVKEEHVDQDMGDDLLSNQNSYDDDDQDVVLQALADYESTSATSSGCSPPNSPRMPAVSPPEFLGLHEAQPIPFDEMAVKQEDWTSHGNPTTFAFPTTFQSSYGTDIFDFDPASFGTELDIGVPEVDMLLVDPPPMNCYI
ncbi:hypothetical protein THRCLA_01655 [Thraustotheca clavata]|uniref:C2H2-type domain-containing protein n=1 Tax=Thraustotheca clavata TaxID=74557 RepID=A0A1W0A7N3_9STRA|nr:hypothetical protein THRCLA_01655 [Thraustotheca clavata]